MTRSKVLKAQTLAADLSSRLLVGTQAAPTLDTQPSDIAPAGRWITEQALEQLCLDWQGRGLAQAQQSAREEALQAAREAAARELKEQLDKLKAQLSRERAEQMKTLALALAEQLQSMRDDLEAQVADWTFVAVCRLLGELSPARVQDTVQQLMRESGMDKPVTVLLHPTDHALLAAAMTSDEGQGLQWRADAGIELGGCQLLGAQETLDARLEVQLQQLRLALDEARRQALGETP